MYGNLSSWRELALAFLLSGQNGQPLAKRSLTCRKVRKISSIFARAHTKDPMKNPQRVGVCRKTRSHHATGGTRDDPFLSPRLRSEINQATGLSMPAKRLTPIFCNRVPSHYGSEMPIAAFSSGDASQNSYFSETLKNCCISSGVGGAGGLFGSNGPASSRKKL